MKCNTGPAEAQQDDLRVASRLETIGGGYLPRVAIMVSRIAASRNANTKYVATRLTELSSRMFDMVPRQLELGNFPQIHGAGLYTLGGSGQVPGRHHWTWGADWSRS